MLPALAKRSTRSVTLESTRAAQFHEYGTPDVMRVEEVDEPHAEAGEIRVKVVASAISPGEVRIRSGAVRDFAPVNFPFRTGFDAAGVVDEVGEGISGVAVGDEVFGMAHPAVRGKNADQAVLVAWAAKPEGWSWSEAAGAAGAVEAGTRVLGILGMEAGETVLINGAAGGTGSVVAQLVIARGAHVIGTASETNHAYLSSLGVRPTTYGPNLPARIRELLPEQTVDAVIDCAGGDLAELAATAGGPARVVTVADSEAARYGVRFSHGGVDPLAVQGLAEVVGLAQARSLQIRVAAEFPLADIAAAHALSETRHARGTIVLDHRA